MRGRIGWRLVAVAAATVLGVGASAAPAQAKGADQASVTGPGLSSPVVLGGDGEPGTSSALAQLAEGSGLFAAMFGPDGGGGGALSADRPAGRLGPRYSLVYRVPADTVLQVRQDLYPLAEGGPVTYTAAGQAAFGGQGTFGGWYAAPAPFKALLASIGVPTAAAPAQTTAAVPDPDRTTAPAAVPAATQSGGRGWALPIALAALLGAAAAAVVLILRRHGSTSPSQGSPPRA